MSNEITDNLGPQHNEGLKKEKIQRILAFINSQEQDNWDKLEATEYNWHQPHCFNREQLKKLDIFASKIAQACTKKFTQLYNSVFNVTISSVTQHFASEFIDSDNAQNNYYLAFGTDDQQQPFGLVGIPGKTAIIWATQLLGDTESDEDSDRDLSQLEESLLFDIASSVIEAFSDSYEHKDIHPAAGIVREQPFIELKGIEELCKITFSVESSETKKSSEAYFLMPCTKLRPVVEQGVEPGQNLSPEDVKKAMLDHTHRVPVPIAARLASTALTLEEIMGLHVDDILLLNKKATEPLELILEGQATFRGRPAKSDGMYAVVIAELCKTK